jgi:hypothetical protein
MTKTRTPPSFSQASGFRSTGWVLVEGMQAGPFSAGDSAFVLDVQFELETGMEETTAAYMNIQYSMPTLRDMQFEGTI